MSESLLRTVPRDAPNRCQAIGKTGNQCGYGAMEGQSNCILHGNIRLQERKAARNYMLETYARRVDLFTTNPSFKSLREEIGILRLTLESTINLCDDTEDLVLNSAKISQLVRDIHTTLLSSQRLEERLNILIDKETLMALSDKIIHVIATHVTEPEKLQAISEGISQALDEVDSPQPLQTDKEIKALPGAKI